MVQFSKQEKVVVEVAPVGKKLTITLIDRHNPDYQFEGDWVGADIKVVGRTIARAYRTKQLATRRQLFAVSDKTVPTTTEESNG